jgi:thioredoxin-related protein
MIDNIVEKIANNRLLAAIFALFSIIFEHISAQPVLIERPLTRVTQKILFSSLILISCYAAAATESSLGLEVELRLDKQDDTPLIDDTPRAINTHHPEWFSETFLNLREDLSRAKLKGKKGIILYFGQTHCAYCDALLQVNFEKEKDIVNYTQQNFDVIALDIWGNRLVTDFDGNEIEEKDLAEFEQTDFTPSLIFYTEDGTEALRLRGYHPPYKFRGALKYVAEEYYKLEIYPDYMARANPPPKFDLENMNEQAFFESPPYGLDRSRFAAERPLVVFFERRNCHACDILHSEPLEDTTTRELVKQFDAVQLDMWSDQIVLTPEGKRSTASEWSQHLGIFNTPTLVFFDQHGKEVFRIDSVVRLYRLRGVLEYVLTKGYETAPTYQRWRENIQMERVGN